MTNLDSILKSRDVTLPTEVHLVKAMVFPLIMYGYESWAIKKAEHRRIDAFELWCWRRLLRVPWTSKRSSQSILKEISPEYSLEGLMLKLKLQHFGHLIQRTDSLERPWCWERLKVGGEGNGRGWDGCMASPTRWTWLWASSGSWRWTGKHGVLQSMGSQIAEHNWATELKDSLYIWDSRPLSDIWFENISSHSVSCLFTFLIVSFESAWVFNFKEVQFIYLFFLSCLCFGVISKDALSNPRPQIYRFTLMLSCMSFIVLTLTFNLVAHLKLIFVYGSCFCYFFLISLLGLQRYKNQI